MAHASCFFPLIHWTSTQSSSLFCPSSLGCARIGIVSTSSLILRMVTFMTYFGRLFIPSWLRMQKAGTSIVGTTAPESFFVSYHIVHARIYVLFDDHSGLWGQWYTEFKCLSTEIQVHQTTWGKATVQALGMVYMIRVHGICGNELTNHYHHHYHYPPRCCHWFLQARCLSCPTLSPPSLHTPHRRVHRPATSRPARHCHRPHVYLVGPPPL